MDPARAARARHGAPGRGSTWPTRPASCPSSTSGGQQQRVAIARALANDPPIVVADEPTGNLDSTTAEAVFELFDGLVDAGKTVIMVTHDHDLAARTRRIVHMVDGRVLDGTLGAPPDRPDGTFASLAASSDGLPGPLGAPPGRRAGDPAPDPAAART